MALYRKKPVVIEAITFDELVFHGKEEAAAGRGTLTNGMPWSFTYKGQPITHEDDDTYLVPTLEGSMAFRRGAMLITGVNGEIYPCAKDIFDKTYEPAVAVPPITTLGGLTPEQWSNGVHDYLEGYEFRGDAGDYTPTEQEKVLLEDALHGFIAEISEGRL
ncbi:hypothetical protein HOT99_gp026 [Caulobacter phage CcrBL10]|uniref:Uncharacterized protein n=1 Tax=Caulobacter phage CcrBL10 TaxID=2283269 RepID=A0A385E985_9CAUD|nr:hypothetical protein HOT99_gp026 [Caulobacter phage CcrBL10]AXQ68230.1 hypothetical protein CcrBL10_gp026 [Caulobacter phage CcrBL10]